jgi:hypothetical protein
MRRAQEKAAKEREKKLKEQGKQLPPPGEEEPILGAPPSIDVAKPRPDMDPLGGLNPQSLGVPEGARTMPIQAPAAQSTTGQMAPPGGGGGQPTGGLPIDLSGVAPYLTKAVRTDSLEQTPYGMQPTSTLTRAVEPNVLSADQAAVLQMDLRREAQESHLGYLKRLAQIGVYQGQDPIGAKLFMREAMNLPEEDLRELDLLMGEVEAKRTKGGEENLKEVYDPKSPTGSRFVSRVEALGAPGIQRQVARETGLGGLGRLAGSVMGLATVLREPTINAMQEQLVNANSALAGLVEMRRSFDPSFLTVPGKSVDWLQRQAEKLSPTLVDQKDRENIQKFAQFRSAVDSFKSDRALERGGKALTPFEWQTMEKVFPHGGMSGSEYVGAWDATMRRYGLITARLNYFLKNGLITQEGSAAALAREPELTFNFIPGGISEGERQMLRIMEAKETQFRSQLLDQAKAARAKGAPAPTDDDINRRAEQMMYEDFGLSYNTWAPIMKGGQ